MAGRARRALRATVRRSSDARLERVLGSRVGLRVAFVALARRYVPGALDGFTGEVGWTLRKGGRTAHWTVQVARGRAVAVERRAEAPAVRVVLGVADLARIAAGEVDPMRALLDGRLDVEGDFAVASRLLELFGGTPAR